MDIKYALKLYFGYDSFRQKQEEIIRCALSGKDSLVLMPTGGGKSLCYQIPAIVSEGTCVVVSPLISLMKDQVEALKANGIEAEALNSTNDFSQDTMIRRRCMNGDLKLLYISPEKLVAEAPFLLRQMHVSLIAIDEAHCISQWGHDFRPEYAQLGKIRELAPDVPVMALTATADKVTRGDIIKQLQLKQPEVFISSFDRPNLSLCVKRGYSTKEKDSFIANFIKARPLEPGIVYCLSRKNTEKVAAMLQKRGIKAAIYHAGLSPEDRDRTQEAFKQDAIQVVCATIAFGMGIDKSNVRWVIHYNMPKSIENYYQEIGRAGRDGAPADTILFYSLADVIQLSLFNKESGQQMINDSKLRRMREYAESSICRRRILLNYFGESAEVDCGNCDVCQSPPRHFDGTRYVQMALSAVKRANEQIGVTAVVDVLRGTLSPTIARLHLDAIPTFGVGRDLPQDTWRDYLLQMLQMGFIEIEYDHYNHVSVTPIGNDVLYGRKKAELCVTEHKDTPSAPKRRLQLVIPEMSTSENPISRPAYDGKLGAPQRREDEGLFEALRALRRRCADEEGFPPYIVFSDKVLHNIASDRPHTLEQFGMVVGIGDFKQKKYGERFVKFIKDYYHKNDMTV